METESCEKFHNFRGMVVSGQSIRWGLGGGEDTWIRFLALSSDLDKATKPVWPLSALSENERIR